MTEPDVERDAARGAADEAKVEPETLEVVTPDIVQAVTAALGTGEIGRARMLVEGLHAADMADLLQVLPPDARHKLIDELVAVIPPEALIELEDGIREEIVDKLVPEQLATALTRLDTEDAIWLLKSLDEARQRQILARLPLGPRHAVEATLGYPEDSAGRLMRHTVVAVPAFWQVGQAIDHLRESDDLPDEFHEVIVVDPRFRPTGSVPLNRILRSKRAVLIADIMERNINTIPVDMDQEDVSYVFQQYGLISAPVVDETGRVVGVITADDVMEIIDEEAEEDILRLHGVQTDDLYGSALRTTRTRFAWLFTNLLTAILASIVIALFDATIDQIVALAILMPIVASMGGNAGTQAMTVTVRALATREITPANALRIVTKEVFVGGLNGLLFAVLIGAVVFLWFGDGVLGTVIGVAMIANMLTAGLAGTLVPLLLFRLRVDPAVASTIFVTTFTDVVGFFSFLGLAAIVLL